MEGSALNAYLHPAFAHGVLRRQPNSGFVDAVRKAHRADGKTRKRLCKQGFRPAIERLECRMTSPGRTNVRIVVAIAAMPDENSAHFSVRS